MRKRKLLINASLINSKTDVALMVVFFNNSSNAHAHQLLAKMILRNFISLQAFTL